MTPEERHREQSLGSASFLGDHLRSPPAPMHVARKIGSTMALLGLALLACRGAEPIGSRVVVVPPRPDASAVVDDGGAGREEVDAGASGPTLPAPLRVSARAESPFAMEVRWEWPPGSRLVNGFEVLAVHDKGEGRLGLANPKERAFTVHRLLPEDRLEVRVRAFDAQGASAPSESVVVVTPKDGPKRASSPPPLPLSRCVPQVKTAPSTTGGCNPGLEVLDATTGLVNVPSASDSCLRRLLATYKGCTRELGVFHLQADMTEVPGYPSEGFPLLHAIAGAGEYAGAQILTLRFEQGRYTVADTAMFCGEPYPDAPEGSGTVDPDVTKCRPPFETCQYGSE